MTLEMALETLSEAGEEEKPEEVARPAEGEEQVVEVVERGMWEP